MWYPPSSTHVAAEGVVCTNLLAPSSPIDTALSGSSAAAVYAALGASDRAVEWLERYQPRGDLHFQLHLRCDPPFDAIKGDRRYQSLLTLPAVPPGQGC